uniref:40S ribosomal protein S3-3-like n=1 Tax=Rhizophora mucronata TaxID=61149 RepID=A0A2P2LRM8_RHIMU
MTPLPDLVTIHPPKDEEEYSRPPSMVPIEFIEVPVA